MPQIKSAKKRVLVNAKRRAENRPIISEMKTQIKKFNNTLSTDIAAAELLLPTTVSLIDIAAKKCVISAKAASHKQAQLYNSINRAKKALENKAAATVVEEAAPVAESAPVVEEKKTAAKKTATKKTTKKDA